MTPRGRRPVFALDDAEADLISLQRAYRRIEPAAELQVFMTSADMFTALAGLGGRPGQEIPAYVLLDIDLPDRNGLDVLTDLKTRYPALPIVMLSGSARAIDEHRAYCIGASGFVTKPLGISALTEALAGIDEYWQCVVSAPDRMEA